MNFQENDEHLNETSDVTTDNEEDLTTEMPIQNSNKQTTQAQQPSNLAANGHTQYFQANNPGYQGFRPVEMQNNMYPTTSHYARQEMQYVPWTYSDNYNPQPIQRQSEQQNTHRSVQMITLNQNEIPITIHVTLNELITFFKNNITRR